MSSNDKQSSPIPYTDALIERLKGVFDSIEPWSGSVEGGWVRNYGRFLEPEINFDTEPVTGPARDFTAPRPEFVDGEEYLEWYSTLRAIEDASGEFVMVSLGASIGRPLANALGLLRRVNPMPYRLVGVEGNPYMCEIMRRHFEKNEVDPASLTVINAVISDSNLPLFFSVTEKVAGANRAFHTDASGVNIAESMIKQGVADQVLRNLIKTGASGISVPIIGEDHH